MSSIQENDLKGPASLVNAPSPADMRGSARSASLGAQVLAMKDVALADADVGLIGDLGNGCDDVSSIEGDGMEDQESWMLLPQGLQAGPPIEAAGMQLQPCAGRQRKLKEKIHVGEAMLARELADLIKGMLINQAQMNLIHQRIWEGKCPCEMSLCLRHQRRWRGQPTACWPALLDELIKMRAIFHRISASPITEPFCAESTPVLVPEGRS
ncbi:hypothetical protein [Janthinobacterium sp. EB271-G4-7A]|uniref:hypothetical protein n=1 Tax=Janthinobacterium sp. EB271-G4-7A TaxID=2775056 RepID=UPI001E38B912|nr:hypothetical protein [Janthinobacterium sp. EB271-G4-7A]MCC7697079.1 hypothetical protein [Janthinobacterium sp. EB271-G4-7A]